MITEARNPYKIWERHHIEDPGLMYWMFKADKPVVGGFDTETTGLHIKKDKPFLIIFGWLIPGEDGGKVFTFHPTPLMMKAFFELAKKLKVFVAQNTKYDLHMLANINWEYTHTNLLENMALARLVLEAVPARHGGDSLALKDLGVNYVHPDANVAEKHIKAVKKQIKADRVKILASALKQFPLPGQYTATGKQKMWGKKAVEDFLKDIVHEPEDLPEEIRELFEDWKSEFEDGDYEPTYKDIYEEAPEEMLRYAADDVITMMEFYRQAVPVLKERQQQKILKLENDAILPFYRMERIGLRLDMGYLEESRIRIKHMIKTRRKTLCDLAGQELTVGQHERIKLIYKRKWNITLDSADKAAMKSVAKMDIAKEPKEFALLISELRTLEKWYSTYVVRLIRNGAYDGRAYTQISQCSAVSGRVGSDFQQFPKDSIKDTEGNEVFHPRRAIIPTDQGQEEGYTSIWYIDLSQVELRVQANYTLLVSGGDVNLCRAYMPFRCKHYNTGVTYDYTNPEFRKEWNLLQEDGETSAWLMPEKDFQPWIPTDVHSETTHKAFPHIPLGTDEFKKWRSKGKVFNFLANYGGGKGAAIAQLDLKDAEADALVQGYNLSFPGVRLYQKAIERQHGNKGYIYNMAGRRYYITNHNDAYKLANYGVQGSCADDLKRAIIEADNLLKNYKSRFVMPIHDELQFEIWKGEEFLIPQLRSLIEDMKWSLVPIVADVEVTYTNWKEKYEIEVE